jgi:hypothetical protein
MNDTEAAKKVARTIRAAYANAQCGAFVRYKMMARGAEAVETATEPRSVPGCHSESIRVWGFSVRGRGVARGTGPVNTRWSYESTSC